MILYGGIGCWVLDKVKYISKQTNVPLIHY